MNPERNSHGLYDAPLRTPAEAVPVTSAQIEEALDNGAFMLSRQESLDCGLLTPYDDVPQAIVED